MTDTLSSIDSGPLGSPLGDAQPRRSRWLRWPAEAGQWLVKVVRSGWRRAPLTLTMVVLLWALAIVFRDTDGHPFGGSVAGSGSPFDPRHLATLFTSGLFAHGPLALLDATVPLLIVGLWIEPRIHWARLLGAGLITQIAGSAGGAGLALALSVAQNGWGVELHAQHAWGPSTWMCGALMAASASFRTLWRRRIRTGGIALLIVLALFGGSLQDLVRLVAGVTGLLIGPWIVGNRSPQGLRISSRHEGRILVAIVVAASALGPLFASVAPGAIGPLANLGVLGGTDALPPETIIELCADPSAAADCRAAQIIAQMQGPAAFLLILMPTLLVLAFTDGLRRGRRAAWIGAMIVQLVWIIIATTLFIVEPIEDAFTEALYFPREDVSLQLEIAPVLGPFLVLLVLLTTRTWFGERAASGTYVRAAGIVGAAAVGIYAVVLAAGTLLDGIAFLPLTREFGVRLLPPVYRQFLDIDPQGMALGTSKVLGWAADLIWGTLIVVIARTFLRPRIDGCSAAGKRLRELLHEPGGGHLSWMTTWAGNSYWEAQNSAGVVAYRVIAGVAITTGDPVVAPGRHREVVEGFVEYCVDSGWTPCLYSVGEETARIAEELDWGCVRVAEEAILNLPDLAFKGKRFQDVRTALNRAKREGIRAEWMRATTAPVAVLSGIAAISEDWVADKGMPEMGFTLGGLDELRDPEVRLLVALDADGRLHGVTSWLPVYRDGALVGLTLDFMRRDTDGFRPAMEFLIASAALTAQEEGLEFLSLSGAPMAMLADEQPSGALPTVLDFLGRSLEPVYGFRSLLAFKAKLDPTYQHMYMVYPDSASLPVIGVALGQAYLPQITPRQTLRLARRVLRIG